MAQQELPRRRPLPLKALNHVSRCCRDVARSYAFYTDVLGFIPVKRPASFEFEGAWMFNYGIGLHLVKGEPVLRKDRIEPKSCHISFQVSISLEEMEAHLKEWGLDYVKQVFVEDGVEVGQLFFHDPDNNMIEVCNCHELPVVPLTEGVLACANVAAINNAAAAVAAAAAMQPMAVPEEAINNLAAALAEVPGLMAAPPAAAAAAAAAAVAAATVQQQEAADAEHAATNGSSGNVRCVATAALSNAAASPDPAASPKMPVTPPSCDAASAATAAVAMPAPAPLPPHLGTPQLVSHHLLADEAASTCSCSLDGCELLHDELALLHTSSCARADDDGCSSVACASSVAGSGGRRSHSFGSASMFSGFSGSCGVASSLSQSQHMSSVPSGLLLGVRDVAAAAAAAVVKGNGGCGGGASSGGGASELDQWLSLLGTATSEPVPTSSVKGVLGAGGPSYAFLASPSSGELAPPPGLSGLSCTELGAYPAVSTERKQPALGCEQAQQQQQQVYTEYLRQRLAVAATAAAAAVGAGAGATKAGGDHVDPRRQKMREHAAMVSVIGAMGGPSAAAGIEPAAVL